MSFHFPISLNWLPFVSRPQENQCLYKYIRSATMLKWNNVNDLLLVEWRRCCHFIWFAIWNLHRNRLLNTSRFTKTNPVSFTSRAVIVSVWSEPALHLMTHCGFSQSIYNSSIVHSSIRRFVYSLTDSVAHVLVLQCEACISMSKIYVNRNTQIVHLANCLWLFCCHFELVVKFRFQFCHFKQKDKNKKFGV